MAERYDGYGFGIKKVMEQQAVTSGIIGSVADIIKVEANTRQRSNSSGRKYPEHCNGYAENSEEDDRISEEESLWKSYVSAAGCSEGKTFARKKFFQNQG